MPSAAEEIKKLHELMKDGILTETEFNQRKQLVLMADAQESKLDEQAVNDGTNGLFDKQVMKGAERNAKLKVDNKNLSKKELFTALLIVISAIWYMATRDSSADDAATQAKIKAAEEAKCKDNLQCWGDKNAASADVYCKAPIEHMAKYSAKWTNSGAFELRFSQYRWLNQASGMLTYLGDKVQFQNGFGAYQNYRYECDIDPATNQVLDVRAEEGYLDPSSK